MNVNQREKLASPADRDRASSAGDTADPDKLKNNLEKYEHLQELAQAILCGDTAPLQASAPPLAAPKTAAMKAELVADFGIAWLRVSAIAFVILILSGFSTFATVHDSDGSVASVGALLNAAHDGDTIVLPKGTFSWTETLTITKGITLQGQTTISGAGTANASANDATIVKDDTPRSRPIIKTALNPSQAFRLTGITFAPGTTTNAGTTDGAITLRSDGVSPNNSVRLDHCHFAQLYQVHLVQVNGWTYGVADHNFIELRPVSVAFMVNHPTYANKTAGHGSWADYPWYGSERFFFIETNTIKRINAKEARGMTDTVTGGRFLVRHNYIQDCFIGNHGTEAGAPRGGRACEVYNNVFNFTIRKGLQAGGLRSGTTLWHDNQLTGFEVSQLCRFANFRETPARSYPIWGIADGTSPWDANDTEGNGTYVEGHPPHLFDSGTDTSSVNSQGVIHDSSKNWTPNQWVGYSIKNTNPASGSNTLGSYIISNTSNTITYNYYAGSDTRSHLVFNAGDTYEIHRVLFMMDQNGSGKSDLLSGTNRPINTRSGTASWAHSSREPCYSWNNVYTPNGHVYGFHANPAQPTTKINIDFFNLGGGFPADTTPSAVSTKYVAALNGVDYTGTFTYPHPLVSGKPTAAQRDTKSQQPRWGKKEESKKPKKKRSWPKQVGE